MAIAQQYPLSTPKSNDLLIGTSIPDPNTNNDPKTVNFSVSSISTLIAAEIPQGPVGPIGPTGATGPKGDQGDPGVDGTDGVIQSIVAGTNVTVDASDPANPIVSATGGGGGLTGSGTAGTLPIWVSSTELGDSFLQKGTQATSLQTSNANTASGASSIAFHQNAQATNTNSTAIGFSAIASNEYSTSIGFGTEASGPFSMVFGVSSTATGQRSKVIAGHAADATGDYAVCGGFQTEAHDYGETVFGLWNKVSTGSQTSRPFSPQNNIFVVGNGTSSIDRSNALELNDQGELTLPFYGDNSGLPFRGLAFEAVTGKIKTVDSPNYTKGEVVGGSSGGSTTLDSDTPGIVWFAWTGADGTFTVNLPDTLSPAANTNPFLYRKFKFGLNNSFSTGGKDVVLTPFSGQTINGASSFTIPSNAYNVVEIWNRGGEWVIISKIIN